jgi:hypothetical protein
MVCSDKFDWVGTPDNNVDEDMQRKITTTNDLTFAQFTLALENKYNVATKCYRCGNINTEKIHYLCYGAIMPVTFAGAMR